MVKNAKKVIVVMPAYNAEKTLKKTFNDIPNRFSRNVILVDDGSHDKTVEKAQDLGIKTFVHPQNRGYGGNQKTCYAMALNEGAGIVVMIHPDYQYDSTRTKELIDPILKGEYEIMLGSRIRTRKESLEGGMPLYKYMSNRILTFLENIVLGLNLSEYHTGFRAFKSDVLKGVPFHKFSDDFVFDQEILVSAVNDGYRIGEIPVPVRYFPDASSINLRRSLKYGIETLFVLIKFAVNKMGLYHSKIFSQR